MRFSVFLTFTELDPARNGDTLFADHLEQAKLADRLGYDAISIPEHPLVHLMKAPHALINAVAIGQHVRCEVGVAVIVVPLHHPLSLAGQIAAADQALGGRLVVGVGRGAYRYEFDRYGVDFGTSRARLAESLEILEKIWHSPQEAISHSGEYWSFPGTYVWPRPVQRPHPPIWVAGQTATTIEWAVDHGYNVLNALMRRPDSVVAEIARVFHDRRESLGLDRGEVKLGISRPTFVTNDPERVRRRIEENQTLHKIHTHMHNFTEHADRRSYVPPLPVPDLPTPEVIASGILLGPADRILERVERYHELGIDELTVGMGYGAPHTETMESLQDFAENVMAPYRKAHGFAVASDGRDRITTIRAAALHRREQAVPGPDGAAGDGVAGTETSYVTSKAWFRLALHRTGAGPGPAVMLIHDTAATAASLDDLASMLGAGRVVYRLDRRGRGESGDDSIADYGLTREAETDIVQALNSLPGPAVLVGLGYGAALALRAATLAQVPLPGLVLYAGGAAEPPSRQALLASVADRADSLARAGDADGAVAAYVAGLAAPGNPAALALLRARADWGARASAAATIARELREQAAFRQVPEALATLRMPVLLLSGEFLPTESRSGLAALASMLPDGLLEEMHGASRLAPELHAEAVAATIAQFADGCATGPPRELAGGRVPS
jgi:alkanesulfonate monooxygenase SsuD/methylene tetrahydromethanopterin reductase-like flavin-dependent oxidoreductase (luciferase family)/pimeloyl-ACP methyl ester carboxylesterase